MNHTLRESSHFSENTNPYVTSLETVLTTTFVCILVLAVAIGLS